MRHLQGPQVPGIMFHISFTFVHPNTQLCLHQKLETLTVIIPARQVSDLLDDLVFAFA
jgi:hypothetical protein